MFWNNFISFCNEKGEAPNTVAANVGVKSSGTVTGWKNGAIPRYSILKKLADYFGVSVSDLTGETDIKKEPAPISESELDSLLVSRLSSLSPEELAQVDAFVQGIVAGRKA